MNITDLDKAEIKKLIEEKEAHLNCEIVPMIVHSSDTYHAANFRVAILVSFLFSLLLYFSPLSLINPIYYLWIQIPGLVCGYFLAMIPAVKRAFITRSEMNHEVNQHAYEAFMHHNLHLTKNHTGLLIFISSFERKIKIITDNGITAKVDDHHWDKVIANFITVMKNESIVPALKATISSISTILEQDFHTDKNATHELSNELIIE